MEDEDRKGALYLYQHTRIAQQDLESMILPPTVFPKRKIETRGVEAYPVDDPQIAGILGVGALSPKERKRRNAGSCAVIGYNTCNPEAIVGDTIPGTRIEIWETSEILPNVRKKSCGWMLRFRAFIEGHDHGAAEDEVL